MNPLMLLNGLDKLLKTPLAKKSLLLVWVMFLISSAWASHITMITFTDGNVLTSAELNGNFSALNNGKQDRVSSACGAGLAISVINANGTVDCETIPQGDITGVATGSGLLGGATSGTPTISIGTGLVTASHLGLNSVVGGTGGDIADNTITAADLAANSVGASEITNGSIGSAEVDAKAIQLRVSSFCPSGYGIRVVSAAGGVTCEPLSNGGYTPACTSQPCIVLNSGDVTSYTVRSVTVNKNGSADGLVHVFFNGFIFCNIYNTTYAVFIGAQIGSTSSFTPNVVGAGAIEKRFRPARTGSISLPLNLSRSFEVTGTGSQTFYVRAKQLQSSSTYTCSVYVGNMSAIYTP